MTTLRAVDAVATPGRAGSDRADRGPEVIDGVEVDRPTHSRLHAPSLLVAIAIMLAVTLYPPLVADGSGRADHALAGWLFWAMSAGFVRGVGFVPRHRAVRWLLSGVAVALSLVLAAATALLPRIVA